jgi:hypothetical protein
MTCAEYIKKSLVVRQLSIFSFGKSQTRKKTRRKTKATATTMMTTQTMGTRSESGLDGGA